MSHWLDGALGTVVGYAGLLMALAGVMVGGVNLKKRTGVMGVSSAGVGVLLFLWGTHLESLARAVDEDELKVFAALAQDVGEAVKAVRLSGGAPARWRKC